MRHQLQLLLLIASFDVGLCGYAFKWPEMRPGMVLFIIPQ